MRSITLHDTQSGQLRPLHPRDPGRVGIYACGPTVYGRIHVGNARPYVVFSLLKRFLVHEGYEVTFVANVTDVNDKIYDAARAAGVASEQLAREMTAAYVADTDGLGLGRPDHEPLATETIAEIVALIETLIARGHAYAEQGDVYFDVRSYPQYGELSHRDVDQMDQGEGDRPARPALKRDPLDFALWKAQKEGEDVAWDSPWGRGRPGWHIECSAMAQKLLGVGFDIHGGGSDLVFPHHENEAAQTAAARGEPLARLWMHNGMVRLDGEKMAKSVGNIFLLHEALAAHGRDALVAYFCGGHYRQPIAYSEERLEEAARSVARIREADADSSPARRPRSWRRCASSSSPRSPRTSTRRRRWPSCSTGCGRPTAATAAPATPTCARCSASSRWSTCWTPTRTPPARTPPRKAARPARGGPRRTRLRRRRPPARRARRAGLGGPRQRGRSGPRPTRLMAERGRGRAEGDRARGRGGPGGGRGPGSGPSGAGRAGRRDERRIAAIARAQEPINPVRRTAAWSSTAATPSWRRCAARATSRAVWATERAAREPWLAARASRPSPGRTRSSSAAGRPTTRASAPTSRPTPTPTPTSCWPRPTR